MSPTPGGLTIAFTGGEVNLPPVASGKEETKRDQGLGGGPGPSTRMAP